MVGGVRIQIADGNKPLPVELAIGSMDNSIHTKVAEYGLNGGIGESCGLWMSKKVKGIGIARYMMWASIASSSQLIKASDYGITKPFLLEKIAIDYEAKLELPTSTSGGGESHNLFQTSYCVSMYLALIKLLRGWSCAFPTC